MRELTHTEISMVGGAVARGANPNTLLIGMFVTGMLVIFAAYPYESSCVIAAAAFSWAIQ